MKKRSTIAILYHYLSEQSIKNYFSSQHALTDAQTDNTVAYIAKLFKQKKYKVQIIKVMQHDLSNLKNIHADYVFNLVDSKALELKIARILDRLQIPHSGSSFQGIQTSNNKIKSKKIFEKYNLPTPKYSTISLTQRMNRKLVPSPFPVIIKPAFEHCSIGIDNESVVTNYAEFKKVIKLKRKVHKQCLLAEEYIPGKEVQVTVLETPQETIALPLAEIAYKGKSRNRWNIYGFDEKWSKTLEVYNNVYFVSPPKKIKNITDLQIRRDAIRAFYALGLRDYARFDLRYNPKKNLWYFLEANANAGIDPNPNDAITASARAYGMTVDDFVLSIVKNTIH